MNTKKAWIFDTGPVAEAILSFIQEQELSVDAIFLSHTHWDHIACLNELKRGAGNPPVYVHELEALDGCESITEGFSSSCASLSTLLTKHTHGHALGGMRPM